MIVAPDTLAQGSAPPRGVPILTTTAPAPSTSSAAPAPATSSAAPAPGHITTEYTDQLVPQGNPQQNYSSTTFGYTPPSSAAPVNVGASTLNDGGAQTLPTVTTWANHLPNNWQFLAVIALGIAAIVWIWHRR